MERKYLLFLEAFEYGGIVRQSNIFSLYFGVHDPRYILFTVIFDKESDIWLRGNGFNLFANKMLNTVEHLPFIAFVHFLSKPGFEVCDFFELLDFIFFDNLFQRIDVEIDTMCEIEAEFGRFLDSFRKIILFELIVKY